MATTIGEQVLESVALVFKEMESQNAKWGVQNHSLADWHLILSEEVGEVAKASLEYNNLIGEVEPVELIRASRKIEEELMQVAAVAIQELAQLRFGRQAPKVKS